MLCPPCFPSARNTCIGKQFTILSLVAFPNPSQYPNTRPAIAIAEKQNNGTRNSVVARKYLSTQLFSHSLVSPHSKQSLLLHYRFVYTCYKFIVLVLKHPLNCASHRFDTANADPGYPGAHSQHAIVSKST